MGGRSRSSLVVHKEEIIQVTIAFHLVDGNYTGQYTSVQLQRPECGNWEARGGGKLQGRVVIGLHFESAVIRNPSLSLSHSLEQLNFAALSISLAILRYTQLIPPFTRPFDFYDAALRNREAELNKDRISKRIFCTELSKFSVTKPLI